MDERRRISSLSRTQLQDELSAFEPRDYLLSIAAALASIGIGISGKVKPSQKYYPLLVLGTVGGLADFARSESRLKPLRARLVELDAQAAKDAADLEQANKLH